MISRIDPSEIVFGKEFQRLCLNPFHGHSKGCPNFNKKAGCPPGYLLPRVFDIKEEMYVIYTEFPVAEFASGIRGKFPDWTARQVFNPRYWQGKARAEHGEEIVEFLKEYDGFSVDRTPEARGVNVTELMKSIGVDLNWQWPPEEDSGYNSRIVSLAGKALGGNGIEDFLVNLGNLPRRYHKFL